jgi:hypothetical protein
MLVQLPGWTLHPVKDLSHKDFDSQIWICRDSSRQGFFTVNVLERSTLSETFLSDYLELLARKTLSDFLDCRSKDGKFYLIFAYREPSPFQETLKSVEFGDSQRIRSILDLLLWFLARDAIPSHIAGQLLREDNLNLSPKGEFYFNYFIRNPRHTVRIKPSSYPAMTASLLEDFFPRELAEIRSAAAAGKYVSMKNFYLAIARRASHKGHAAELNMAPNPPDMAKKEPSRKGLGVPMVIVIALISFLLMSWRFDFFRTARPVYYVKSIGTVQIEE